MPRELLRVLVVDDHPLYLRGVVAALSDEDGIQVVGRATNGREALDAVAASHPDVVVMDLSMPEMGGVEATARITADYPATQVLVLTFNDQLSSVFEALQAGAKGYYLKNSTEDDLGAAVRHVAAGNASLDAPIANMVLDHFTRRTVTPPLPQLTDAERRVLEHVAAGRTNREIARMLDRAEKTIRNQVSAILTKLQVSSRNEAASRAREAGLKPRD